MFGKIWSWIKGHKKIVATAAAATAAAAGGIVSWTEAGRQVLTALGIGGQ